MCTSVKRLQKSRGRFAVVLLAVLSGTGCTSVATPPPASDGIELPSSWIESRERATADQAPTDEELVVWWQQLGDPVLNDLVGRTIAGNVDLATAAARVQEARARRGLARSERGPSVSAGLSRGRSEPMGEDVPSSESYAATLEMAWEADLFRAKRLSIDASQADLEAESENLRAVRVSLIAETVVAYTELRVAEARLRVLDGSISSRQQTSQLTAWREQAGLASRLEANQALSSLGQARSERPATEQSITEARLRLSLLAGEIPGALDELLAATPSALPVPPDSISAGIPADTLRQRPDLRSAERQIEAAWARLGVARAGRFPTVRLTGSLDSRSTDFGDLFDLDSMISNLLSGFTAPIFESGRIRQRIAIDEARYEQATLAYRTALLEALAEVERALSSFSSSQERIVALEEATAAAAEAAELADQRYSAGLVDLLSVLDTQRTLFSLEEQLVVARGEHLRAFSNLYRALGGGWEPDAQERAVTGGINA